MARWARCPPSGRVVAVGLAALAVVLALAAIEALWGWPDALSPNGTAAGARRLPRP
jgi:hypothetical protein